MTISIIAPKKSSEEQEQVKKEVKSIFTFKNYQVKNIVIDSFQKRSGDKKRSGDIIPIIYVEIQDESKEEQAVNDIRGEYILEDYKLQPRIHQEIVIKNIPNDLCNEKQIRKLIEEESEAKIQSDEDNKTPIRIRGGQVYINMKNRNEVDKVIKNLNRQKKENKILSVDLISVFDKNNNQQTLVNKDTFLSEEKESQSQYLSLEEFYKQRDYEEVTKVIGSFVFNLCSYLSREIINDNKE